MSTLAKRYLGLFVCFGASLSVLQSCSQPIYLANPVKLRGKATREEVVTTYLQALKDKDAKAILKLTPTDYDAAKAIEERIEKLSDREIYLTKITYEEVWKPSNVNVTIESKDAQDTKDNFQLIDSITLSPDGARWYLILGESKNLNVENIPPPTAIEKP
jgi:hypothetical protein